MGGPFVSGVGAVCSADIAVPEHGREVRFYSRVLSTGPSPLWREDLMNNLGLPVIGLGERIPEYERLPQQWMPHIQVADVADSVRLATELGGQALMHSQDESGSSQWAVLLDPRGAAFGIIPVVPAEALPALDPTPSAVGSIAWLDLTVPDAPALRDFYRRVIGWSAQPVEMEHDGEPYADFNLLRSDGEPAAGICHARGVNAGLPPVWMLYLPVGDLAESLRRVEAEGGQVLRTLQGLDGQPTYAAVQDPVGACFALAPG